MPHHTIVPSLPLHSSVPSWTCLTWQSRGPGPAMWSGHSYWSWQTHCPWFPTSTLFALRPLCSQSPCLTLLTWGSHGPISTWRPGGAHDHTWVLGITHGSKHFLTSPPFLWSDQICPWVSFTPMLSWITWGPRQPRGAHQSWRSHFPIFAFHPCCALCTRQTWWTLLTSQPLFSRGSYWATGTW